MKLCTCNNCGNVYEDLNGNNDQIEYPDNLNLEPLEYIEDHSYSYYGCPKCHDDGNLVDNINRNAGGNAKILSDFLNLPE
jgi:hypothetical protein